jgi:hypothetical protein
MNLRPRKMSVQITHQGLHVRGGLATLPDYLREQILMAAGALPKRRRSEIPTYVYYCLAESLKLLLAPVFQRPSLSYASKPGTLSLNFGT